MTDFEKTIKREMTREKFSEIRDHVYGDGNNTFNGNDAYEILEQGMDVNFLTKRFYAVVQVTHYNGLRGATDVEYTNDIRSKLKPYITIP